MLLKTRLAKFGWEFDENRDFDNCGGSSSGFGYASGLLLSGGLFDIREWSGFLLIGGS